MRWTMAALVIPLLVVGACASGGEPGEPVDDQMIAPSGTKPGGPSAQPQQVLTGRLGVDDVEGGCPYLEREDGTRFEVVFPDGWQVDPTSGSLVGPGGQRVDLGSQLSVRGAIATERSSICQLGPIFEASAVLTGPE